MSVAKKALLKRVLKKRPVMALTDLSVGRSAQTVRTDVSFPGKQEEGSPD